LIRGIGLLFSQTVATIVGQENAFGDRSFAKRPALRPCCSRLKFVILGRYSVASTPYQHTEQAGDLF
jgi:hypothetical protein